MTPFGFLRVAAAAPRSRVADCRGNADAMLSMMGRAEKEAVAVVVFPELGITGYTCADLFQQTTLQHAALTSLDRIVRQGQAIYAGIAIVGLPLAVDDQLFNCAAVIAGGQVLGVIPKSFIPNYKEFYEGRWFASAATARCRDIVILGKETPFGTDLLFTDPNGQGLVLGVEICEDLWVPIPPSSFQALQGANVLVNLSASNEVIGKSAYRRQLVVNQSGRCVATYVYAGSGVGESTTDVVFGGHCLIAENGVLLAESERFAAKESLLVCDTDLDSLRGDRSRNTRFGPAPMFMSVGREFRRVAIAAERSPKHPDDLRRSVMARPFVPAGKNQLRKRCEDIFNTQVTGLRKRLEHVGKPAVTIGISGGLDSTLALLVTCKTIDALGMGRESIHAFTMPGFGTTERTIGNARTVMKHLGVSAAEVDIRSLCLEEMRSLGHRPLGIDLRDMTVEGFTACLEQLSGEIAKDLIFENVQARMRTSILMNSGFVIGTGDMSELALGWCTYNGDHMSMYNPNVSIPKTLVKFLVQWAAENEFADASRQTLLDIVGTEISPELLPRGKDGKASQATEAIIGPYELHDFFLFHFLRYGAAPEKILWLATHATFDRPYTPEDMRRWLRVFLERFFANQFKRSCLPDGPKVGSVSLSPRGDWRMPSDAQVGEWLKMLGD